MKDICDYKFFEYLTKLSFVEEIWLFGSRARGDNSPRADIDLAIICPKASKKDWLVVLDIIENADTLLKIDCINFGDVKDQNFKNNILKFKKILYQSRV